MQSWKCAALAGASLLALACSGGGGGSGGSGGGGGGGGGPAQFPLGVDGRRLEDSRGQPFLLSGDAAWSLMVELSDAEVESYLEDRRQRGFNTVLVNLIERGFGGPANREGEEPFEPADDFDGPNAAYFDHAAQVIDAAARKNMLVLLTPAYLGFNCGDQGWCAEMEAESVTTLTEYGRFLGQRFRSKSNVIWVHGGDTDAGAHGMASRVSAIANGIVAEAPAQLHTAHCSRGNSAVDCYDEPWLDINTTYSECGSSNSLSAVRADYDFGDAFFYIEGDYENEGASLGCLIDQFAWAVLGGGNGHVFGNNPIWLFDSGWPSALDDAGSQAMTHVAALFRSRAWQLLVPDLNNSVQTGGTGSGAAAALASNGESILVYVPTARTVTVNLSGLTGTQARGWWFDPVDGSTDDLGLFTGSASVAAPGRRVLVLDDAAKNLGPPGS